MHAMPTDYIKWIRAQMGTEKIMLVFCGIILTDEHGRILFQLRADRQIWGLSGGALELGEDAETCARRELREETGYEAGPLSLVGVYSEPDHQVTLPNGDQFQPFLISFTGQVSGGEMNMADPESVDLRWFEPTALPDEILPSQRPILDDFLSGDFPRLSPPNSHPQADLIDQIKQVRPVIGNAWFIGCGALVAITNEAGEIWMMRRADNNVWMIPGGYSDIGESVTQTAVREVREETGLDIELDRLLGIGTAPHYHVTYPNGDQIKGVSAVYRAHIVGGAPTLEAGENLEQRWMSPAEMLEQTSHFLMNRLLRQVAACLDSGYFVD